LSRFKITYRRLKPAGGISFDPSQEFVDEMELPASTPEEAALSIARNMSYMHVVKIERTTDEAPPLYGEARYGESHYGSSLVASGATTVWPHNETATGNIATIAGSLASFVSNYSAAQSNIETLRSFGIGLEILNPLQQNIVTMKTEAESLRNKLDEAVKKLNQEKIQELAGESPDNVERAVLATKIVDELVACNMLSKERLGFEFFNCSPDIINALHTHCKDGNDFKIKIGALANIFEIDLKSFRARVSNAQDDWKSIKLFEVWAGQNSVPFDPAMLDIWRKIVDMRNSTFPFHKTDQRFLLLVSYFGQSYPPNYPELWREILSKFAISTAKFRNLLSVLK